MIKLELLVLGVLCCAAVCQAEAKAWNPDEIGEGAFSLQPDQTLPYKTVDNKGESTELTLRVFLPEGH